MEQISPDPAEPSSDLLDDSAWANTTAEVVVPDSVLRVDDALILTGFAFGHTVALDENGVIPLVVAHFEGVNQDGTIAAKHSFLIPHEALRLMTGAMQDVLSDAKMPTIRDILTP